MPALLTMTVVSMMVVLLVTAVGVDESGFKVHGCLLPSKKRVLLLQLSQPRVVSVTTAAVQRWHQWQ